MPIRPITTLPWTGRKLTKGDALTCLELFQQKKRLVATNSAGAYLKPGFDWGDLEKTRQRIRPLEGAANRYHDRVPNAQRVSENRRKDLAELRATEQCQMKLHEEVTRALSPIMTFLNEHVDTALQKDLDPIATATLQASAGGFDHHRLQMPG